MIHAIRKLARAIHRRSIWQVLVVHVVGSWLLFEAVGWATAVVGLPAWVPTMTLVLIVVMTPLVVATAAVQGGLPGLRIEDLVDPNELVGLTPDEVHVVPEAHPLYDSTVLTWRNMVLGGVTSAALLVTSVVAYMTMWAFGIGPVGSLLAQGIIQEQDAVVLVDFRSLTDDGSLAELLTEAFDIELSRSTVVSLSPAGGEDARLVISGEVSRSGSEYVLAGQVAIPGGSALARFEETASEDEILVATVRLTERVRERLGESLRTIREGDRLAPITTESSEALALVVRAGRASNGGDLGGAIDLVTDAVRADPAFAMGWYRLGVLAERAGDAETAREAYQAVIDLWGPTDAAARTVSDLRGRIARLE